MTKKEWVILVQGIIGTIILYFVFPENWWRYFILNYCFAFVYETSMDPLFTYHKDLVTNRCIAKTDMNFIFPLGWNLIFATTAFGASLFGSTLISYIVSGLVIGNLMEFTFYKLKFWSYNLDAKYLNLYKPFQPKLLISGVPIQIMFGYSLIGILVWLFTRYVIK